VERLRSVIASAVLVSSVAVVLGLSPHATVIVAIKAAARPVLSIFFRFFMVISK
jgi:hypothetical protein